MQKALLDKHSMMVRLRFPVSSFFFSDSSSDQSTDLTWNDHPTYFLLSRHKRHYFVTFENFTFIPCSV